MVKQLRQFYLAGSEVNFEDADQFACILQTHAIDEPSFEIFSAWQSALAFRETQPDLFEVDEHFEGEVDTVRTRIRLPDVAFTPHTLGIFAKDAGGRHQIGGAPPANLQLPSCTEMQTSFQYLGFIDGTDPFFSWIGVPYLHITYPLFECNFGVYLDWTDPWNPRILNPETFDPAWWDETQSGWDTVRFTPVRYTVCTPDNGTAFSMQSLCGVPLWLQAPEIPVCPVTGEPMRFVCQLASNEDILVTPDSEGADLPFADEYLCFGDCGYLYVFYHPESKVMHLQAQW